MVPEVNLPDVAALPASSSAGEPSAGHGQRNQSVGARLGFSIFVIRYSHI